MAERVLPLCTIVGAAIAVPGPVPIPVPVPVLIQLRNGNGAREALIPANQRPGNDRKALGDSIAQ